VVWNIDLEIVGLRIGVEGRDFPLFCDEKDTELFCEADLETVTVWKK
jgi:hypothetical protein